MKKLLFVSTFYLFFCTTLTAQNTFQKVLGGSGTIDYLRSVQQTTDGGYIMAGYTNSFGAGNGDVYLLKTDATGNLLWTRTFGGAGWDYGYSVQQTTDGGYIITGGTWSFGAGIYDVYLLKTDATGNLLWTRTFGGVGDDKGYSVQQTTDGGYVIAGCTYSFGAGSYDVYLVKTDATGNLLWTKTFGGVDWDVGSSVQQTTDGGYIITGYTENFGAGFRDVYLLKTDATGNLLWTRTFGGVDRDIGNSVQQTTDGGYIITGSTTSFGAGSDDVYLLKTDVNGNLLWTKTFGGADYDEGNSVQQTTDGGYIITGGTYSFGAGNYDAYLLKTDANGNLQWSKALGGPNKDYHLAVDLCTDGGYISVGAAHSWAAGAYAVGEDDFYIIKTDSLGNSGCNEVNAATLVSSGGIVGSGGISGSGGVIGSGGVATTVVPDTLTLCFSCITVTTIDTSICDGDSLFVGGAWQTSNGSYYDTLITAQNCDSVLITQLSIIDTQITTIDTAICDGDSLFAGGAWQTLSGTYYDVWMAANSCDSIIVTQLSLKNCLELLFVPGAFSPNGDGANDKLYVRGEGIQSILLIIYNCWGEKVFETNDLNEGWDGRYKGKELNAGIYVYHLSGTFADGAPIEQKGNITLLR